MITADAFVARLSEFESVNAAALVAFEDNPQVFNSRESARNAIREARARAMRAASAGSGLPAAIPEGFALKGTSTLYKGGEEVIQWVKTDPDKLKQLEILREGLEAFAETLPRLAPVAAPASTVSALCNLYTLTDCHLGMMASEGEAGEAWNLDKGEAIVGAAFDALIAGAPKARSCVISQLGDFLHSDGLLPVTPKSKHALDQSHRFADVVRSAHRLLRRIIDAALASHEEVVLVVAEGNHDESSSIHFRVGLSALYEREPRLKIIDNDLPFYAHAHGATMLGFHHGHITNAKSKASANALALRFASLPEWASTSKRYIHTGHHHDEAIVEVCGAKCYAHPTIVAPDAYASRNFGGGMRQMSMHVYHDKHGKVGENTVTPEMLA